MALHDEQEFPRGTWHASVGSVSATEIFPASQGPVRIASIVISILFTGRTLTFRRPGGGATVLAVAVPANGNVSIPIHWTLSAGGLEVIASNSTSSLVHVKYVDPTAS